MRSQDHIHKVPSMLHGVNMTFNHQKSFAPMNEKNFPHIAVEIQKRLIYALCILHLLSVSCLFVGFCAYISGSLQMRRYA